MDVIQVSTLQGFLGTIVVVFEVAADWIRTVSVFIMSTPILFVPFVLGIGFTVIRMFKALR